MTALKTKEQVKFWKSAELGNLELLHASYKKQRFSPHFHEGHVIGVIEKGVLGFDYRGEKLTASAGQINIADPGEVHNGFSVSDSGWQYRMFYLQEGQLEKINSEISENKTPLPFFKQGVLKDKLFAGQIISLHKALDSGRSNRLELETLFYNMIVAFIMRHAPQKPDVRKIQKEKKAVGTVKEYIHEHER